MENLVWTVSLINHILSYVWKFGKKHICTHVQNTYNTHEYSS